MNEEIKKRTGSLQHEKDGIYIARVSVCGRRFSCTTATKDINEAKQVLASFVAAIEAKYDMSKNASPLMKEWSRYLCSGKASFLSQNGRSNRFRAWRNFSHWMYSAHPEVTEISAVTRPMVEEYIRVYCKHRSAMTQNLCIGALRDIFGVLCLKYNLPENPLEGITARIGDSRIRRELSVDEVRRLLVSAQTEGSEWALLFAIAAYTGMRLGDCCRLAWNNVNLAHGIIQIVPHKTRRYSCGQPITIPIHEQLQELLAVLLPTARSGFVLPAIAADYECHSWRIAKVLARIFDRARIIRSVLYDGRMRLTPYATFHSLRHSFVSFAANSGAPLVVVQAIVGHMSSAMTRHYYHANEAALRKAVEAIPSFAGGDNSTTEPQEPQNDAPANVAHERHSLSLAQRLKRAESLFARGLVSVQEHQILRARILAEA